MKRITTLGCALLTAALTSLTAAPVDAHGSRSVRAELLSLQRQIDRLRNEIRRSRFEVVFRDATRSVQFAPGATEVFALGCLPGEVVVAGGYNSAPAEILQIVLDTPFFDGVNSGWRVDFHNPTDATVTVDLRVTASCTKGVGLPETE